MIAGVYSRDLTECGIPCGLDALTACRMGVMSWLDAMPKPPKVKGGTPSRATRDGVRGKPPTKNGAWAHLFARWGGKFFAAPPAFFGSLGVSAQKVGSATQINNFVEIEFTRLSPLR